MSGLHIIITGAARGIGRHLTYTFLSSPRGHTVTALDMDGASLARLPAIFAKQNASLNNLEERLLCVTTDVGDQSQLEDAIKQHLAKFHGKIDVLINNASPAPRHGEPGQQAPDPIVSISSFETSIKTGLLGPFILSRLAAPFLSKSPTKGRIINIGSTRAHMSEPSGEGYAAAKGGIIALTHSLAMSLSPNVLVNAISPGWSVSGLDELLRKK